MRLQRKECPLRLTCSGAPEFELCLEPQLLDRRAKYSYSGEQPHYSLENER